MIDGTEIRQARERARLTQEQLAHTLGVSLRTVGNWERGASVPRSSEARLRDVLADHLDVAGAGVTLRAASDAELLAEIARRFTRGRADLEGGGTRGDTPPIDLIDAVSAKARSLSNEELGAEAPRKQPGRSPRWRAPDTPG